jgi:hypothetical protein
LTSDYTFIFFKEVAEVQVISDKVSQLIPRPLTDFVIELLEALGDPAFRHGFSIFPVVTVIPQEVSVITYYVDHLIVDLLVVEFLIEDV